MLQTASAKQGELFQVVNSRVDMTVAESEAVLAKALDEVRALRYQLRGVSAPAQPAAPAQKEAPKSNLIPKGYEVMSMDDFDEEEEME